MTDIVFETRNLSKIYHKTRVVDEVNIKAYAGEVFGFLGPNGAGKTTTLGMALGLVHPSGGEVYVLGERITPNHVKGLRQVGALLGAPALVPYLSAWDNLALAGRLTPGVDKKRISETLEMVGLIEEANRMVGKFSTGMKQRAGLGLALLQKPRFVILDEPTNGLDPAGMREMRNLIRSLVERGTSVLLSSHLLHEVQQVCDRIAVLNKGRVVAQGRVKDLLLAQKPAVLLTIRDEELAVRLLRDLPGVEEIRAYETSGIVVTGVTPDEVMDCLLKHHLVPTEISAYKSSLENIFLDLTAEEKVTYAG